MIDILSLLGRDKELFSKDIEFHKLKLMEIGKKSSFLVLGGAGTIG